MAKARLAFYLHIALTIVCAAAAYYVIHLRWTGKNFDFPSWLFDLFRETGIQLLYCAALLSTVVFPAVLASLTVGRIRVHWWLPLMIEDVWLSGLQLLSLFPLQPLRS